MSIELSHDFDDDVGVRAGTKYRIDVGQSMIEAHVDDTTPDGRHASMI
jgi:hypothetical protein